MIARHLYISALFTFFVFSGCLAQLQRYPLTQVDGLAPEVNRKAGRTQDTPLALPFFDDFSTYRGVPAANLWINGGVYVNNQFGLRAPSKGVATFDGLRASGQPYNFDPNIVQSPVDTLTSKPINLTGLTTSNVVFSFFWQAGGLGEVPDADDFLLLQFKAADGTWQTVSTLQTRPGELQNQQNFVQTLIPLTASNLFHSNFQFRFLSFGRPAGMYDIWNIDYVYLGQNRSATQQSIRDLTVSRQPRSVLKNYTAMPWEQFNANPTAEGGGTDSTLVNNLENNFNFFEYTYTVTDVASGSTLFTFQPSVPEAIAANQRKPVGVNLTTGFIPPLTGPRLLQSKFAINTPPAPVIPGVDLRRNDTVSNITVLDDYYAYDDGSAEYGVGVRQQQGRVAVQYVLSKPGTMTDVKLYFTKLERSLAGQTFVLSVWKRLDGRPESVLYQRSVAVNYTDTLNKFYNYTLETPVSLADTFYVGWQQTTSELLTVGFDVNTDSRSRIFYNITGNDWEPNTEQLGSVMIRPVFGPITTAVEPDVQIPSIGTAAFRVFPNPTNGPVSWDIPDVTSVQVLDVLGKQIKTRHYQTADEPIMDLAALPAGIYVLHLQTAKKTFIRKILVQR